MRKSLFQISIISVLFISISLGMDKGRDDELEGILARAHGNPVTKRALMQEQEFRQVTVKQIDALREKIAKNKEEAGDLEKWKERVLKQIEKDVALTKNFNEVVSQLAAGTQVRFNIKFNKLSDILGGVQSLTQKSFFKIVEGELPAGYDYHQSAVTMLGAENPSTIWGNCKGTELKATLWYIFLTSKEGEMQGFRQMSMEELDSSALFHASPLPETLPEKIPENLRERFYKELPFYTFARSYEIGSAQALVFPHSGYAFGGHRREPRYPEFKPFGPLDCSHWFSVLMNSPSYTTADQVCAYWKLSGIEAPAIPKDWENGPDARYLLEHTEVVTVRDPQQDIQPGLIYCHKSVPLADPTKELIGGGHTALVLGLRSNNNIVTLGYNRDIQKNLEGFGIQDFTWTPEPGKQKMLFRVKS
ncbi:MAG: hypothetical protein FJX71_05570 [Alphaproteobacteria bacterium]|nr:hypothetical protein [Alphaproteobacteria bacterium]